MKSSSVTTMLDVIMALLGSGFAFGLIQSTVVIPQIAFRRACILDFTQGQIRLT